MPSEPVGVLFDFSWFAAQVWHGLIVLMQDRVVSRHPFNRIEDIAGLVEVWVLGRQSQVLWPRAVLEYAQGVSLARCLSPHGPALE